MNIDKLRSLTIKCDFDEPDAIAQWIRMNILRKFSYKCTTTMLIMWFWNKANKYIYIYVFILMGKGFCVWFSYEI